MRHVVFRLSKGRYALPLEAVREVVVAPTVWTRVPHTGPAVKGVMTLRGRVVPVVDLSVLLTLPNGDAPTAPKVVLLELARRDLGLLVVEVEGIEPLEKVGPPPRGSRSAAGLPERGRAVLRGMARVGAQPVSVLDVEGVDAAVAASFANG